MKKEEDEVIGEALKTIHRIFRRAKSPSKKPEEKKKEEKPAASRPFGRSAEIPDFPDYMKPLLSSSSSQK